MSDIVKRARKHAKDVLDPGYPYYGTPELVREMADEIARLRLTDAERECLEWAEEIAGNCEEFDRVSTLRGLLERAGGGR